MDHRTIYRAIILKNGQSPNLKSTTIKNGYLETKTITKECEDNFRIFFKIKKHRIDDAFFCGFGCLISTAAINIILNTINQKNILETQLYLKNYQNMINGKSYQQDQLGDLIALSTINEHSHRITCALIGANAILEKVDDLKNKIQSD